MDLPEPDLMSEAAVLSGMVKYGSEAYLDASSLLRIESFTLVDNQVLWKCLSHILTGGGITQVDRPTLYTAANSLGFSSYFQQEGMRQHVETIYRIPVHLESIEKLSIRLRILDVARDLRIRLREADELLARTTGDESVDFLLKTAESPAQTTLNELAGGLRLSRTRHFSEGARERFRELCKNPQKVVGVPTGFQTFDRAHGGCRPGSVTLICARMKTGKTHFSNNLAINVAGSLNVPVLNVDTEMNIEEQQNRAAAALSGLWTDDVETGDLSREQQRKLGETLSQMEKMPRFYEEAKGLRFDDILTRIRRWVSREVGFQSNGKANPCLIVFDYFKLMGASDVSNRMSVHHTMGFQAEALKNLMGELGTPCIAFAQANRDGIDFRDERILRDADRILDSITAFWVFRRKGEGEVLPSRNGLKYTHELYYCMSRHGKGLDRENYINIETDYSRGYMGEGPTRDELFQQMGGALKGVSSGRVTGESISEITTTVSESPSESQGN